jgi:hypothetical protein
MISYLHWDICASLSPSSSHFEGFPRSNVVYEQSMFLDRDEAMIIPGLRRSVAKNMCFISYDTEKQSITMVSSKF